MSTAPASTGTGGSTDGWRAHLAAGSTDSEKELKQLERYESPSEIWRKARELEKRMSSGELRTALPKGATAQEVAQWRKDNGIPEKPEDYKITMPAGRQPPKEDDKFLKSFLKGAHDSHYTQAQVDQALNVFYQEVDRQEAAITEGEKLAEQKADEKLRQEWGGDYRVNKQLAEALLARAPAGFRDRFMNGFLQDGTPVKASVEAWKWIVQMEREINPASTVLPGLSGDPAKGVGERINELKKLMANSTSDYWKGPKAEGMQAEYRQLLEAQEKLKAKVAA